MDHIENRFQIGDRVKLRDIDTSLLSEYARVGQEGTVIDLQRERYGYPRIAVEWDKEHWTWNGQPDSWAFQEWFDLVPKDPPLWIFGPGSGDNPVPAGTTDGNRIAELVDRVSMR